MCFQLIWLFQIQPLFSFCIFITSVRLKSKQFGLGVTKRYSKGSAFQKEHRRRSATLPTALIGV
jgi:hypothetical protein